jgi:CRISPR-associated protein Cas1
MEPYRPFVDWIVMQWLKANPNEEKLNTAFKTACLNIATLDVLIEDKTRPLMVAIKSSSSSLYKCYTGEKRSIAYPTLK